MSQCAIFGISALAENDLKAPVPALYTFVWTFYQPKVEKGGMIKYNQVIACYLD